MREVLLALVFGLLSVGPGYAAEKLVPLQPAPVQKSAPTLVKPPATYQPPLAETCVVRGTIRYVPSYLKLKVSLRDVTTSVGSFDVMPNTSVHDFHFDNLACTKPPNSQKTYSLHYRYYRQYGLESSPRWSSGAWAYADTSYGLRVVVSPTNRVFTDVPRFFNNLATSGVLVRRLETDKSEYQFGDVIRLTFSGVITGATLPGTTRTERARYRVIAHSAGLTTEIENGTFDVTLGHELTKSVSIYHSSYSRGSIRIELVITGDDYNFTTSLDRTID